MFTSEKPNRATLSDYQAENARLRTERGTVGNPIRIAERRATAAGLWPDTPYKKTDPNFAALGKNGTQGPLDSLARESGKTPAEAKRLQDEYNRDNTRSALGRGPGGVDFSTLELQYVGNPVKGKGLDYSMKADLMPDEDENPGWGGQAKLEMASDAFFTWLALSPDRMWVNLNPDQPDTIMDEGFSKTDTGRILLEADMEMKRDWSRALDPKKSPGKEFMAALPQVDGVPCWGPGRNWIVPGPAKVREQDGGIYILDAPLLVHHAPMDFTTPGPGERCDTKLTREQKDAGVRLMKQWIMPAVQEKVNHDPKYADLRRVYTSRVAAEWIRQQDAKKATDFHAIIDSDDLRRWPLRGENKGWDKRTVWERMRKSFTEGEFQYEWPSGGTIYTYTVGGVDFSQAPKKNISGTEFTARHRELPRTTKDSVRAQTSARDTDTAFLGGSGSVPAGGGGPGPTPKPTPTPAPTPKPTTKPAPKPTDGGRRLRSRRLGARRPGPLTPPPTRPRRRAVTAAWPTPVRARRPA